MKKLLFLLLVTGQSISAQDVKEDKARLTLAFTPTYNLAFLKHPVPVVQFYSLVGIGVAKEKHDINLALAFTIRSLNRYSVPSIDLKYQREIIKVGYNHKLFFEIQVHYYRDIIMSNSINHSYRRGLLSDIIQYNDYMLVYVRDFIYNGFKIGYGKNTIEPLNINLVVGGGYLMYRINDQLYNENDTPSSQIPHKGLASFLNFNIEIKYLFKRKNRVN